MAGAAVITVASMVVQMKYVICPIEGWIEPLNLYMVVVARPSERKSPVMREVMAVVYKYTKEYNEKKPAAYRGIQHGKGCAGEEN